MNGSGPPGGKASERGKSKDGFSRLFSVEKPEIKADPASKPGLPPRPPDYDDYWYQVCNVFYRVSLSL